MIKRLLVLALFLIALYSDVAQATLTRMQWMDLWASSPPPAALGVTYWSIDFYHQTQSLALVPRSGYLDVPDTSSPLINVRDGERRTVWMFGNSQLFGYYVSDADTAASALQRLLPTMRVMNYGSPARTAAQQANVMRRLPIGRGDIVVWLDGSVDVGLFYDGERRDDLTLKTVLSNYRAAIIAGYQIAHSHGAQFYHFLQPYLWSMPIRPDEHAAEAFALVEYRAALFPRLYPVFAATLQTLPGVQVDLTHSLDAARRNGAVLYFDGTHLNARGNALLARAIYDVISAPITAR